MEDKLYVNNARIVLENGIIWDGVIVIENGKIKNIGNSQDVDIPLNSYVIDAKDAYVGPGFVDIHTHGGNKHSIYEETEDAVDFFLRHGTTTILASPPYSLDFDGELTDFLSNENYTENLLVKPFEYKVLIAKD